MKLRKICLASFATAACAIVPALSTGCSLFLDYSVYEEGSISFSEIGKFTVGDKNLKLEKDKQLTVHFQSNKYNDKEVYNVLASSNVYISYKNGKNSYSEPVVLTSDIGWTSGYEVNINSTYINKILDQAKGQRAYTPELRISFKDLEVNQNNVTWNDIATLSEDPIKAKETLSIGDILKLTINGKTHKICIADFNKYKYDTDKTATFLFEFVNLITQPNGEPMKSAWDTNITSKSSSKTYYFNHDYSKSTLANYVNTTVGNLIKTALGTTAAAKVKSIERTTAICNLEPSHLNLARSVSDYNTVENKVSFFIPTITTIFSNPTDKSEDLNFYRNKLDTQSSYHAKNGKQAAIKKTTDGYVWPFYWTDTPEVNEYNKAWYVNDSGEAKVSTINDNQYGIAPCFCM